MRLARRTLRTLGVRVTSRGVLPAPGEPLLVVANHVSWLDVYVLNAVLEARFVAKSETATWPVVGTITRGFEAIFIVRESRRDAARVKDAVAAALRAGERMVVFPEATTTDGTHLGHFHPAMFQAAIDAGARVLPVALRYPGADGAPDPAPVFVGETTFLESLVRVLRAPALRAELTFGPLLSPLGRARRELARIARAMIGDALSLPACASALEAPARPRRRRLALAG